MRKQKQLTLNIFEFDNTDEFSLQEKKIIQKAIDTAHDAWAPYSGFKVGAAVLLENGEVVIGNNQENAAYPSGLCAERVALFSAHAKFPQEKIMSLVICALKDGELLDIPVTPCGSCRQVMAESNLRSKTPMKVILVGAKKVLVIENSNELLPLQFDATLI